MILIDIDYVTIVIVGKRGRTGSAGLMRITQSIGVISHWCTRENITNGVIGVDMTIVRSRTRIGNSGRDQTIQIVITISHVLSQSSLRTIHDRQDITVGVIGVSNILQHDGTTDRTDTSQPIVLIGIIGVISRDIIASLQMSNLSHRCIGDTRSQDSGRAVLDLIDLIDLTDGIVEIIDAFTFRIGNRSHVAIPIIGIG